MINSKYSLGLDSHLTTRSVRNTRSIITLQRISTNFFANRDQDLEDEAVSSSALIGIITNDFQVPISDIRHCYQFCLTMQSTPLNIPNSDHHRYYVQHLGHSSYRASDADVVTPDLEIVALKQRRNLLISIVRLPPEILSTIFEFTASAYRHPISGYFNMGWTGVSHVCHQWRQVALRCLSLWSYVDFSYPGWAPEILRRAQTIPLMVAMKVYPNHLSRDTFQLFRTLSFLVVKELDIQVDGALPVSSRRFLATPSPSQRFPFIIPPVQSLIIRFPLLSLPGRQIFAMQDTSRLRHLELHDFRPFFSLQFLSNLANLVSFKYIHGPHTQGMPVGALIAFLRFTKNLECLHIEADDIPLANGHPPLPVALPHLSSLYIKSNMIACYSLLGHLFALPSSVVIELKCSFTILSTQEHPANAPLSPPLLINAAHQGPLEFIHSLNFSNLGDCSFTARTWALGDSGLDVKRLLQRKPRLKLDVDFAPDYPPRTILEGLRAISQLGHLRHLRLALYPELTREEWLLWFGHLQMLDTIHVDGDKGGGLLSALSAPSALEAWSQTTVLCFPALRHLTLENWNFDDRDVHGKSPFSSLKGCLDKRQRLQVPLHSLSLYRCRFLTAREVKCLSRFCHSVYWDGFESFTDSEDDNTDDTSDSDEYICSDSDESEDAD